MNDFNEPKDSANEQFLENESKREALEKELSLRDETIEALSTQLKKSETKVSVYKE